MIHLNRDSFKNSVLEKRGVTIVDFYADWCGPCKILGPIMEKMEKDNKDNSVSYAKINVDENQEIAALYGIMSIPTVIFFKDGEVATQKVGVRSQDEYEQAIKDARQG